MGNSSEGLPLELSRMKNRAFYTLGLRLGSVFLGLFAGVAGANPFAAGNAAAPVCTSCHEQQGQKLAQRRPPPGTPPRAFCPPAPGAAGGEARKGRTRQPPLQSLPRAAQKSSACALLASF